MPIGKVGCVRPGQDQFADVTMVGGSCDKRVSHAFRLKSPLGVKNVFAQSGEDVIGKLVGSHEIPDRVIDPDPEGHAVVRKFRVADQVSAGDITDQVLSVDREAEVCLLVPGPLVAVSDAERLDDIVEHG